MSGNPDEIYFLDVRKCAVFVSAYTGESKRQKITIVADSVSFSARPTIGVIGTPYTFVMLRPVSAVAPADASFCTVVLTDPMHVLVSFLRAGTCVLTALAINGAQATQTIAVGVRITTGLPTNGFIADTYPLVADSPDAALEVAPDSAAGDHGRRRFHLVRVVRRRPTGHHRTVVLYDESGLQLASRLGHLLLEHRYLHDRRDHE